MPSFDISSEVDMVALKNAVDTASKQITNPVSYTHLDVYKRQR